MDVTIPCPCPETPHESDTVTCVDVLDFHRAQSIIMMTALIPTDDLQSRAAEVIATMNEGYLLHGIARWTLRDPKPVEVTKANIRRYILERPDIYPAILRAVDDRYSEAVAVPLGLTVSTSSPPSRTTGSTSAKRGGGQRPRKPSKRSSISTIPTDATETTSSSLDGVSNFSQSSESAA